jgi:4-amino-4-deoxy-L-arabinose transferase-like glycosyltransferase
MRHQIDATWRGHADSPGHPNRYFRWPNRRDQWDSLGGLLAVVHLWLISYGPAGAVLLLGLALGYPLGRRILRGPAAPVFALMLGLATLSLVVCVLSWLGLFSSWSVLAIAIIATGVTTRGLWLDLPKWWASRRRPAVGTTLYLVTLLGALLFFSVLAIYPSTAFDATSYHLPLAREMVATHGLTYDPYIRFSFFPQANESVFAVVLLLTGNPVSSAAFEFLILAAGTLLIPLWFMDARRNIGAGFIGSVVLLSSPVLIWVGTAAMIDTWTMVFVLSALLCGLDAGRNPKRLTPLLLFMGVFLGAAAASKYSALVYGSFVVVGVVIAIGVRREVWRGMLGAAGGFLLVAGPWYAWTFHSTGDPLYPFATGLFGNRPGLWNKPEIQLQQVVQRATPEPGIRPIFDSDVQYLAGKVSYNTGAGRSPLSWWLGLGILGLFVPGQWRNRTFIGALVASVLSVAVSLDMSADPRFFVPALGTLSVTVAFAAEPLVKLLGDFASRFRVARLALIAVACAAVAIGGLWTSIGYARMVYDEGAPPTGNRAIAAYLAPRVECYPEVAYLNRIDGSHYRAWGYACEQSRYYSNGILIGDAFSTGARDRIFNDGGGRVPTPQVLAQRLAPLRVGWVILPAGSPRKPQEMEAGGLFKFVMAADHQDLYKVLAQPPRTAAHPASR